MTKESQYKKGFREGMGYVLDKLLKGELKVSKTS